MDSARNDGERYDGFSERWEGETVAILASGPSLTRCDVDAIKAWKDAQEGRRVIAVNLTYTLAPWADALVALDADFWRKYKPSFDGHKFCSAHQVAERLGGYSAVKGAGGLPMIYNSGLLAVWLANALGAAKVILLGFDAQKTNGKAHWHADHLQGMSNAGTVDRWPDQARLLAKEVECEVVNCSRQTAITAFRRGELEQELCS